jgi:hypothetical protein
MLDRFANAVLFPRLSLVYALRKFYPASKLEGARRLSAVIQFNVKKKISFDTAYPGCAFRACFPQTRNKRGNVTEDRRSDATTGIFIDGAADRDRGCFDDCRLIH